MSMMIPIKEEVQYQELQQREQQQYSIMPTSQMIQEGYSAYLPEYSSVQQVYSGLSWPEYWHSTGYNTYAQPFQPLQPWSSMLPQLCISNQAPPDSLYQNTDVTPIDENAVNTESIRKLRKRKASEESNHSTDSGYDTSISSQNTTLTYTSPSLDAEPTAEQKLAVEHAIDTVTSLKDQQVVFKVLGRLCLTNSVKRYNVTVGEIKRRISIPEQLTTSCLGPYLRRAKTKSGGEELRSDLLRFGIFVPMGRRAREKRNTVTCLVEEEAKAVSIDLDCIVNRIFSQGELANGFSACLFACLNPATALRDLQGAKAFLCDTEDLYEEAMTVGKGERMSKAASDHKILVNHHNLMSHGLGLTCLRTWIRVLKHQIDVAIYYYSYYQHQHHV